MSSPVWLAILTGKPNNARLEGEGFQCSSSRSRQETFPLHHVFVGERVRVRGQRMRTLTPALSRKAGEGDLACLPWIHRAIYFACRRGIRLRGCYLAGCAAGLTT